MSEQQKLEDPNIQKTKKHKKMSEQQKLEDPNIQKTKKHNKMSEQQKLKDPKRKKHKKSSLKQETEQIVNGIIGAIEAEKQETVQKENKEQGKLANDKSSRDVLSMVNVQFYDDNGQIQDVLLEEAAPSNKREYLQECNMDPDKEYPLLVDHAYQGYCRMSYAIEFFETFIPTLSRDGKIDEDQIEESTANLANNGESELMCQVTIDGKSIFFKKMEPFDIINPTLSLMSLGGVGYPKMGLTKMMSTDKDGKSEIIYLQASEDLNSSLKYTPTDMNQTFTVKDDETGEEFIVRGNQNYLLEKMSLYNRSAIFFIHQLIPSWDVFMHYDDRNGKLITNFIERNAFLMDSKNKEKMKLHPFDARLCLGDRLSRTPPFSTWKEREVSLRDGKPLDPKIVKRKFNQTRAEVLNMLDQDKFVYKVMPRALHQLDRAIVHLIFTDIDKVFKDPNKDEFVKFPEGLLENLKLMRKQAHEGMTYFLDTCEKVLIEELKNKDLDKKVRYKLEGQLEMIQKLKIENSKYQSTVSDKQIFEIPMSIVNQTTDKWPNPSLTPKEAEKLAKIYEQMINESIDGKYDKSMNDTIIPYIERHSTNEEIKQKAQTKHHTKAYTTIQTGDNITKSTTSPNEQKNTSLEVASLSKQTAENIPSPKENNADKLVSTPLLSNTPESGKSNISKKSTDSNKPTSPTQTKDTSDKNISLKISDASLNSPLNNTPKNQNNIDKNPPTKGNTQIASR